MFILTNRKNNTAGFSLLEMLLVLTILGSIIYMGTRFWQQKTLDASVEKTSLQMQQILNSGVAFFMASKKMPADIPVWPLSIECLTGEGLTEQNCNTLCTESDNTNVCDVDNSNSYIKSCVDDKNCFLKSAHLMNPLGGTITASYDTIAADVANGTQFNRPYTSSPTFHVSIALPIGTDITIAKLLQSKLPVSEVTGDQAAGYSVTTYINTPGEYLNRVPATRFVGLYHHGACVPVPECPPNTVPKIMLAPVSISGKYGGATPQLATITSFTAYANGGDGAAYAEQPWSCGVHDTVYGEVEKSTTGSIDPKKGDQPCPSNVGKNPPIKYWRACVQVITSEGDIFDLNADTKKGSVDKKGDGHGEDSWGKDVTVMAITRCAIPDEPMGSAFNVYSN